MLCIINMKEDQEISLQCWITTKLNRVRDGCLIWYNNPPKNCLITERFCYCSQGKVWNSEQFRREKEHSNKGRLSAEIVQLLCQSFCWVGWWLTLIIPKIWKVNLSTEINSIPSQKLNVLWCSDFKFLLLTNHRGKGLERMKKQKKCYKGVVAHPWGDGDRAGQAMW